MTKRRLAIVIVVAALAGLLVALWLRHRGGDGETGGGGSGSGRGTVIAAGGGGATGGSAARTPGRPAWFTTKGISAKRVAGIVTFEGARVAGATVRIRSPYADDADAEVKTDANGAFDFGPQPPPGFNITADAPDRVAALQWVDLRDPTAKPQPDKLELKLLGCSATVSGKILDSSGGPIEKAHVTIGGTRSDTDAAGAYHVCTRFGPIQLRVTADGYGGIHVGFIVTGNMSRDVVLVPEVSVTGKVVRVADGAPVPDAIVTVSPNGAFGRDGPTTVTVVSDADGKFRAGGLAPGELTASAIAENLTSESPAKATVVVGQPPPELTIRMVGTVNVSGKVVMGDKPVAGAKVQAIRKSPLARSRDAITQADGTFSLVQVAPGENVFQVTPYEVVKPKVLDVKVDTDGVVIEVSDLASIAGRTLRGKQPSPRAVVDVQGKGVNQHVIADDAAHYDVKGLPEGTYRLQAYTTEGGAFAQPFEVTVAAGEHKTDVDLDIPFGGAISGTVTDQDGKPAGGVHVRFMAANGDVGASTTSPDGTYWCNSMMGGMAYTPAVFPTFAQDRQYPWAGPAPAPVMVSDGNDHVKGINLVIQRERDGISGIVVDETGAPVADARVRAQAEGKGGDPMFASWLPLSAGTSTADGRFTITDLAPGTYALEAHAPDGSEGVAHGITAGTTTAKVAVQHAAGIDGTLTGFTETPAIYAQSARDRSRFVSGQLTGNTFSFRGLAPGPYTVTAQSTSEGGAAQVDLTSGQIASITIASNGRGTITATLVPWKNVGGAPAGLSCHVVLRAGDNAGITNWDPATAPRSDAQGHATFDPAPAGDVFVQCFDQGGTWSDGAASATLARGGTIAVQIPVVKNTLTKDAANDGGVGFDLASQQLGARVSAVTPGTSAAGAGIVVGDQIVAVDGTSVAGLTPFGVAVAIQNHPIGGSVSLGVQHGAQTRTVTLTIQPPR